jgi:mannose-6-phosphate isomerase
MWMGDHPNGQATEISTGKPLGELVSQDPEGYLPKGILHRFHGDLHLPFLFKILSFDKALPLQAHPDKSLAGKFKNQNREDLGQIVRTCSRAVLGKV